MECRYKGECPMAVDKCDKKRVSKTGGCALWWRFERERWKKGAQEQAAAAGELRIALGMRLEAVRTDMAVTEQTLLCEDNRFDREILSWKLAQKRAEAQWLEEILYGKGKRGGV